ncbi:MAG: hypothetical protein ACI30J_00700 [Paludibacteraceae bacterium]
MKKILTLVVALCTLTAVHATYYLHESFEQEKGQLTNVGLDNDNLTDWMYTNSVNMPTTMNVVEGDMSWAGYASTAKGGKLEVGTAEASHKAIRNLVPAGAEITSGSVFVAAIINVDSLRLLTSADASASTYGAFLFGLANANFNYFQYARLYVRSVMNAEGDAATGYQLGIAKLNESVDDWAMADATFNAGDDVLVVVEYVFNEGSDDNDSVNLYINPTSTKPQPSAICVNDIKTDITGISKLLIAESACQQGRIFVDEIKVTNDWATLFDETATVDKFPVVTVTPAYPSFTENDEPMEVDSTYTTTITITGKDLTGDITLSTTRPDEVTFSKTTLTKAEIEADGGVEVVLTAKPTKVALYENAVVSLTDADDKVLKTATINWTAVQIIKCATIAELNEAMEDATGESTLSLNFIGEAIVTYNFVVSAGWWDNYFVVLQDATGACLLERSDAFVDYDDDWNKIDLLPVGAKVTGLDLSEYTNDEIVFLAPNQSSLQENFKVLGTGEITPKVVTPAELKNHPFELVTLQNVTFAPKATVTTFDIENKEADANGLGTAVLVDLKQGETVVTASVSATMLTEWDENDNSIKVPECNLIGTTIPTDPADVTGIVWAADEIRLRSTADIKAATTGINNAALSSEEGIEKFVRDGQLVIRMNGVEYNVLGAEIQ